MAELSRRGRIHHRHVYAAASLLALVPIWSTQIFAIIATASRAFALHCAMAALHALSKRGGRDGTGQGLAFEALAGAMLATAVLAIPAETAGH